MEVKNEYECFDKCVVEDKGILVMKNTGNKFDTSSTYSTDYDTLEIIYLVVYPDETKASDFFRGRKFLCSEDYVVAYIKNEAGESSEKILDKKYFTFTMDEEKNQL